MHVDGSPDNQDLHRTLMHILLNLVVLFVFCTLVMPTHAQQNPSAETAGQYAPTMTQQRPILENNLRRHVYKLADEIGERNIHYPKTINALHVTEAYIRQTLEAEGFEVTQQDYTVKGVRCANLEVTIQGETHPEEIILIGAHYDSVPGSPGANDNGSGVAALLELARLFRQARPARTIRLVAFVNEEPPFFYTDMQGSMVYSKMARARGDDIRLMMSLETIGYYSDEEDSQHYPPLFNLFYPDTGNFIALVTNLDSRGVMHQFADAFRAVTTFPMEHLATFSFITGVDWSDHRSFWAHDYPALMVTDTAPYRYPHYHSPRDTADKVMYGKLAELTQALYEAILELARSPIE